ncbi:hypothetical protein SDC9_166161 [bioreactor metagenome]|uniref:Uncharacterized protein n=1 Tax=bioreactor metagenome TaxID=1076179 RepID=A0A645FW99_9ZZZZ
MACYDPVVGLLRYGAEVQVVDHPGTSLPAENALFLVVPYLRVHSLVLVLASQVSEHADEGFLREIAVAIGARYKPVSIIHIPSGTEAHAHHGLSQHIEGVLRYPDPVDVPPVGGAAHDGAFHKIVGIEDQETALGHLAHAVTAPAHPLKALGH